MKCKAMSSERMSDKVRGDGQKVTKDVPMMDEGQRARMSQRWTTRGQGDEGDDEGDEEASGRRRRGDDDEGPTDVTKMSGDDEARTR